MPACECPEIGANKLKLFMWVARLGQTKSKTFIPNKIMPIKMKPFISKRKGIQFRSKNVKNTKQQYEKRKKIALFTVNATRWEEKIDAIEINTKIVKLVKVKAVCGVGLSHLNFER